MERRHRHLVLEMPPSIAVLRGHADGTFGPLIQSPTTYRPGPSSLPISTLMVD
jgi:hypothetical protein